MARLVVVKKSRKPFKCMGPCQKEIPVGSGYRRWRMNFRPDHVRCMTCPTPPRSFFTSSEILAMAWDLVDGTETNIESYEDFETSMDSLMDGIQEIVDLIQEKLYNIEQGIGHTGVPVYDELEERKSMYEDWLQEVESLKGGINVPEDEDQGDFNLEDAIGLLDDALAGSPE